MKNLENPDAKIDFASSSLGYIMSVHAKMNTVLDILAEMKATSTGVAVEEVKKEFNQRVSKNMEEKTQKLLKYLD